MRTTPVHKWEAFHRIKLRGVLMAVLALLALIVSSRMHIQPKLVRISCVNNLKQIGTDYSVGVNNLPHLDLVTNVGHGR
jgi:hypothetical protein